MIDVIQTGQQEPFTFQVTVREGKTQTRHQVTMAKATYQKLTGEKVGPDRCVEMAFEYLLERERKEDILGNFDITLITSFFPNFSKSAANFIMH